MLKPTDVNEATIRQAIDDLDIGVPIRSWEVVDGKLYLYLAYAHEPAVWSPPEEEAKAEPAPALPAGDLGRLLKSELLELARAHDVPGAAAMLKADLVAALDKLREMQEEPL